MIRAFQPSDAERLREIYLASVSALGPLAYCPEQLRVWASRAPAPEAFLDRIANGATILLSVDGAGSPAAAFLMLEAGGHLDLLYCHPDHARRGHAAALIAKAEALARQSGITQIVVEASEIARPVFERAGYTLDHRRDFEIDGVPIHNYRMSKALPNGSA